jgi:hypothetical protein
VILTHVTLIGLTPFIPLPFVDDLVKGYLQRRMVRSLADGHGLRIWEEEVRQLADDSKGGSLIRGAIKSAALAPLRLVLRKTFMVLAGKRVVDLASEHYHRGWMLDLAFANGWCAPHGGRSPREVRQAIDDLLKETPMTKSPVTRALKVGFERSPEALMATYQSLRSRLATLRGDRPGDDEVARVVDGAEEDPEGLGGVVEQLRSSLTDVPREHFDQLEQRLRVRLGPIELGGGDPQMS